LSQRKASPPVGAVDSMNKSTSLYLDFVRALAALIVFFAHAGLPIFAQGEAWLHPIGHEMVVIFFVLSGFVIAYAVSKSRDSWRAFSADRLSRLYSVILPALLLTVALDSIGRNFDAALYATEVRSDHYAFRMFLAAGFLNQSWQFAIKAGSNSPLWSLAYEFWYYFLFGGLVFARRWWKAVPVVVFFAATGYKIALLLPVWLMGVGAFYICRRQSVSARVGAGISFISLIWIILILAGRLSLPGLPNGWAPDPPLFFSRNFIGDFMLSLLVTANFVGTDAMLRNLRPAQPGSWWAETIRFAAGRSFSLYVFHFPVLVFCKAIIPFDPHSGWQVAGVLLLALIGVVALSEVTEQRREPWRRLFRTLFGLPADRAARVPAGAATVNAA
jgi:peptidoglycan/LPS O-acetylase OafA/YrhL